MHLKSHLVAMLNLVSLGSIKAMAPPKWVASTLNQLSKYTK